MKIILFLSIFLVILFSFEFEKANGNELSVEKEREGLIISQLKQQLSVKQTSGKTRAFITNKRPSRDLSMLFKEAKQNMDSYSEDSREYLENLFRRPDINTANDLGVFLYLQEPISTFEPDEITYPGIGGKFKFWYVTHTALDSNDVSHETTLDYVKSVAAAFEEIYNKTINEMDYPIPPDDSDITPNGGDNKYDVYILNCGAYLVYGYTMPEGNNFSISPSYIVIDNDYTETEFTYYNEPEDSMKVTAAHEFHHAIQLGINGEADGWIMEATSVWIEDQVYDDIDDNLQYLKSSGGFFAKPHVSLDSDANWYNSWIWLEYLEEKWGQDTIKTMWEDYLLTQNNGMSAVERRLSSKNSSRKEAFTEFVTANYAQENFYSSQSIYFPDYYPVNIEQTFSKQTIEILPEVITTVNHLAARYYKYTPSTVDPEEGDLQISINGPENKDINGVAIIKNSDGSYSEVSFPLDSSNNGTITIENYKDSQEVVVALINYSLDEDFLEFTLNHEYVTGLENSGNENMCFIYSVFH